MDAVVEWSATVSDGTTRRLQGTVKDTADELRQCNIEQQLKYAVASKNKDSAKSGSRRYEFNSRIRPDSSSAVDMNTMRKNLFEPHWFFSYKIDRGIVVRN